jgi:Dolichyl-phosphate-mannose-protein mannosyltransferase
VSSISARAVAPDVTRRALLPLAFVLVGIALGLSITGGFTTTIWGWRVSAHTPETALAAASVALAIWFAGAYRRQALGDDIERTWAALERYAASFALGAAGLAGALAVRFGTFSAAGSDASGYVSQAAMLWSGRLSHLEPLASVATWPGGAGTLVPLGWRTGLEASAQVPTYPPGLPMLLAIPLGIDGIAFAGVIVASMAAVAVWGCARLAQRLSSPVAGVIAAVWLATSPTFLMQSVQPMSDVPVTAAWLLSWVLLTERRPAAAGLFAGLAVLIRPNLAPLAVVPALYLWLTDERRTPPTAQGTRGTAGTRGTKGTLLFSVPVLLSGLVVAWFHWRWYGSPLLSGYGSPGELYSLSHIAPNVSRYVEWLTLVETPLLATALLVVAWPGSRVAGWALAFAALVLVSYTLYLVVEQWTYLRFLLPAMALVMAIVSAAAVGLLLRLPRVWRGPLVALVVLALVAHGAATARAQGVFDLASVHRRAVLAGAYLAQFSRSNLVIMAGEQSGSMRYYTGCSIVRWDLLASETFPAVFAVLHQAGQDPWIVLDAWEEEPFRARFQGTPEGALDWPPALDAGREVRTRAWRVADRDRFRRGERILTVRLR